MKKTLLLALVIVPLIVSSCATARPPQAYHATDNSALVIESIDARTSRILLPTATGPVANGEILNTLKNPSAHRTVVVILENYSEPKVGTEFRDRGTPWFIGLRCLGFEHIVFLQGNGAGNPEGLVTLAKYD